MVTDEEHKQLQKRVGELERKVEQLNFQLGRLLLKNDAAPPQRRSSLPVPRRDTTRYRFDGKLYTKRQLAYTLVTRYLREHRITDYDQAVQVFPDYIQGSLGVIKPADEAEKYAGARQRYFFADEDILLLSGVPCVVCSQWEKKNIPRLLSLARELGYEIDPVDVRGPGVGE